MSSEQRLSQANSSLAASPCLRLQVQIRGAVQGVGFRPFIYRLATELGLTGWVSNSVSGVTVEVEGDKPRLDGFLKRIESERPRQSVIRELQPAWLNKIGFSRFEIRESRAAGAKTALVLPDIATCPACLSEIFDPINRRFGYPFTNCTNCGPRFTVITSLPYDRANTSMRDFKLCPDCQREYDDPTDRRFHAQPNACPVCGPHLELWDTEGRHLSCRDAALTQVVNALGSGAIVAIKGLGGFHLFVAAHLNESVQRLRQLKHRKEKPFALMFPSLARLKLECEVSALEAEILGSTPGPIVLLRRKSSPPSSELFISSWVAPKNPYWGAMLPSNPLHHLLMARAGFPMIATSGNLAEEPICIDEKEAITTLRGIADFFLVHNRPITRHADDSIVRVMAGREMILRRARGYAPLPIQLELTPEGEDSRSAIENHETSPSAPHQIAAPVGGVPQNVILAVGAHLKNTVALAIGPEVFISQHIGDLETIKAYAAFERVIEDFQKFYEAEPNQVVADAHPDYLSTQYALKTNRPVVRIQHHYAHVLSCMAENGLEDDVLGVSWDGTGFGNDGTIWGGEFLIPTANSFRRFGRLRTFPLPGGDKAILEPRRSALGVMFELFGVSAFDRRDLATIHSFSQAERRALRTMLVRRVNSPDTSSAGRLFDAVAALIGLRQQNAFEGQAAMELEWALEEFGDQVKESNLRNSDHEMWISSIQSQNPIGGSKKDLKEQKLGSELLNSIPEFTLDWRHLILQVLEDVQNDLPVPYISLRFHHSMVEAIVTIAQLAGKKNVVLSGGCFQNKYLTERTVVRLREAGFCPHWHRLVPPNDGGIALGQISAARKLGAYSK